MIKNSTILLCIILGVFFLLILGGFFQIKFLSNMTKANDEIRGRISELDSELKNLKVLENFLAQTDDERRLISGGFVGKDNLLDFIEELEKAGAESGLAVRVESANFDVGQAEGSPSFRLQATGSFQSLFKLMLILENTPYEISFEDVSLSRTHEEKGKNIWTGVFVIKLLSYES